MTEQIDMFEMTQEKEKVDRPELIEEIKGLIETLNEASLAY